MMHDIATLYLAWRALRPRPPEEDRTLEEQLRDAPVGERPGIGAAARPGAVTRLLPALQRLARRSISGLAMN